MTQIRLDNHIHRIPTEIIGLPYIISGSRLSYRPIPLTYYKGFADSIKPAVCIIRNTLTGSYIRSGVL